MISNLALITAALPLVLGAPIASNGTGYASLPLRRQLVKSNITHSHLHRRDTSSGTLGFNSVRYLADFSLGGQEQKDAIMDTGSSNTWITQGSYDSSQSSTYHHINSDFSENYGYGNNPAVTGDWATDTLNFGDVSVPNYHFGVLNSQQVDGLGPGLFAMGPQSAESESEAQYPTLPQQLKRTGVIGANAFSLFISKEDQSEATLIFGGVDHAKYSGPLYTIPLDTTESYGTEFYAVNFEFQGHEYTGGVLDSGTPGVLLPQSVADSIAQLYGGTWNSEEDAYFADSKVDNPPDQEFKLGGITVTIPGDEFYVDGDEQGPYQLGVSRSIDEGGSYANILGEVFMRHLYLVYDLDNEQIGFAPVKYSSESNVVAIGSSIPGSTPAPDQSVGGSSYSGNGSSNGSSGQTCIFGICF